MRATATYTDPQGPGKDAIKVSENAVRAAPVTNNPPVFSSTTATRSVAENSVIGTHIGTPVTAADAVTDTLTYSLGGIDAASFSIVPGTGQLATGIELDYEIENSYEVTVTASDPSTESDSITVTITVINEDEAGDVQLSTVQPQVGTELTGILTDPDGAVSSVTWQWARSGANDSWSNINSAAAYEPVAVDVGKYLRATATYTDPQGGSKTAGGVSENPVQAAPAGANAAPVFSSENASRSVSENAALGSNIGTPVIATDAGTLTYSLSGTDAGSFGIVDTSGQLQTKAALDYEGKSSYEVTVTATDPSGEADTITVTITVVNVDEDGEVTLSLLQPQAGTELTAALKDPDGDPSNKSWQWTSGGSNVGTGNTYTPLASDVGEFLQAAVTYTDPQGSGKTANGVSAYVVQEAPSTNSAPAFSAETAVLTVLENTPLGRNIGAPFVATDPDNDTLTYSLGGTDAGSFSIVQATGQLQTKDPLDSVARQTYTVVVTATDPSAEFDTITVTIKVISVDDTPGVSGPTSRYYKENDIVAVGSYAATNAGNETIVWGKSGDDSDDFSISTTGELTFNSPPDFEHPSDTGADNVYHVTVEAFDGTDTGSLAVTITVTNEDEPGLLTLPFGQPEVGIELDALLADPDGAVSGETWKWESSSDGQTNWATISGAGLASYTPVAADVGKYLQVTATYTDPQGPDKTAEAASDGTVLAEPNSAPQFSSSTAGRSVPENTHAGRDIGSPVTATDTPGDALTYELGGGDAGSFNIVSTSGQLQTKDPLDYESKSSYSVIVTVTDSSSAVADVPVTITVTNVEEAGTITFSSSPPQVDTAFTATLADPDGSTSGESWEWEISSDQISWDDIDGATSSSYTPVTDDVGKYLRVNVSYTDGEGSGKSKRSAPANPVRVAPENNVAPSFPASENGARSVPENTPAGRNIGAPVDATDTDANDTLTYTKSGTDHASFDIVSTTGQLRTKAQLNYEIKSSYSFTVTATDPSGLTATKTVTVSVTDVNEPPGKPAIPTVGPASTSGHTSLSVSWNAPSNRGPAISGYEVEYRKNGSGSWLDDNVIVTGTGATISGLTPDSDYQARVQARSQEGTGTWSDPGNGRTAVTPVNLQAQLTANYHSASYSVTEGGSRSIRVTLSGPADRVVRIPITATNGTAEYGDYQLTGLNSNTLSIAPGETYRSFTFRALHESDRSNETVTLGFGNLPSKVTAGARDSTTVSITDDDLLVRTFDENEDDDSDDDEQDEKTEIDPISNIVDSDTSGNRAPVFVEGVSTRRTVPEHAERAVYIGSPVIATDPDGDVLTYSLGDVFDGQTFIVDSAWGQLMTKAPLDFETKASYTVVAGVTDGRGAGDTMVVTINVTDIPEVPIDNPQTQALGKVTPDAAVTIETPDGVASVTFPAGSRESSYQVRIDSGSSNCSGDLPEGELQASLAVEYFDNWGSQEHDVVLDQPATIMLRLNASELGGVNRVLAAHRRGGFNVFARSDGAGEWSNVEFTLEANDRGIITLTVGSLYRLHCFAAATDAAAFVSVVQPAVETPTPTPTPQLTVQQAPEPTPTPTPTPSPGATLLPTATPTIVPDVTETPEPKPPVISLVEEVSAAPEPEAPDDPITPIREESVDTPLWPILMMIAGVTMMATGGGLYLAARRRRKAEGRP